MPGTVFVGFGALFMRSVIHWWTAASMHMGSGSGRFITVGMQVNPLVLGLASVSLPSAPYTMTPTSFTRCAGAALSANVTCSCWGSDFTSFTVLGFFPSLAAAIPPQTIVNPRTAPRPNISSFFMSSSCVLCECDDLHLLPDNPTLLLLSVAQKKVIVGGRCESMILVDPSLCLPERDAIGLFTTLANLSRFAIHCREMFLSSNRFRYEGQRQPAGIHQAL